MGQSILRQFKQALHYGSGRTHLILKQHPDLPVDELLIDAALHHYDYDPQCSGNRAVYLNELLSLRSNRRELLAEIARRFETDESITDWDASQCYDLLCTSPDASPETAAIVRRRFVRRHVEESDFGLGAIAGSQGMPGIIFLAEVVGGQLLDDPEDTLNCCIPFDLDENVPPEVLDWRAELNKSAAENPAIAAFIDAVRAEDEARRTFRPGKRKLFGIKEIEELLNSEKNTGRIHFRLSAADKQRLREYFFAEKRRIPLIVLCKVLTRSRGVNISMLPKLYELSQNNHVELSNWAIETMSQLRHKRVREIALHEISQNRKRGWAFADLLRNNWKAGDDQLLIRLFNRLRSTHSRHSITLSYSDAENIPVSLQEFLIRHTSCGSCRERLVRTLLKNDRPSEELMRELLHDSQLDIREAVIS